MAQAHRSPSDRCQLLPVLFLGGGFPVSKIDYRQKNTKSIKNKTKTEGNKQQNNKTGSLTLTSLLEDLAFVQSGA